MPGELQEIAAELREAHEMRANKEYLARKRDEGRQKAEANAITQPEGEL